MPDLYEIWIGQATRPRATKEGRFVTIEGRPVFIGGPGQGGGGSSAGGGDKPSFQIGITSARPGKPADQIQRDMEEFGAVMSETPIENLSVQLGTGGWEGGEEPTFITSYDGNGEALSALAEYGKKWNQDGVLVMQRAESGGEPQSRISFNTNLDQNHMAAIEQSMTSQGIGGWTWGHNDNGTMLMAVNITQWGGDATQHRQAIQSLLTDFAGAGMNVDFEELSVLVVAMDASNYDDFIK